MSNCSPNRWRWWSVVKAKDSGRLVAERCDMVASIPLDPRVESLNASVAAALACFEIRRARSIVR